MKRLSRRQKKVSKHFFAFQQSPLKLTLMFSLPFAAVFFMLIATLMFWEKKSAENDLKTELKETASAYFQQILITRLWNANYGGVYVEITNKTQPNPYLKDDLERDIVTVDGRKYTKINPAYMTRQLSELADKTGRYKFHITSLRPLNPQNRPDEWETQQLISFGKGKKEAYEVMQKEELFRYMAPLYVEAACLKCHEKQNYKLGEVRGGISVDIPMGTARSFYMAIARRSIITFGIVGMASLSFIVGMIWLLSKKIVRTVGQEMENERLKAAIHLAGAAAHELRQPMTTIIGFSEFLNDKDSAHERIRYALDIIVQQCYRMDEIIKRMVSITKYKTKTYSEDTEIFDLEVRSDRKDREQHEDH